MAQKNNLNHFPTITYEADNNNIEALLRNLVEDDKVKTQAMLDLSKIVADLTSEVKKLIDDRK